MGETWYKCHECGRFIPWKDFVNGKASHRLLEPDSDLGTEKWETLCRKHSEHPLETKLGAS